MNRVSNRCRPLAAMFGCAVLACVAAVPWGAKSAQAQEAEAPRAAVTLAVGGGRLLRLSRPAATVFMAEPQIADIQTPAANRLFVFGKKPGRTTLFALDAAGNQVASWWVQVAPEQGTLAARAQAEAAAARFR